MDARERREKDERPREKRVTEETVEMEEYLEEPDPDELPAEERPLQATKDARRPPREEVTPRTPSPPPHAPRPRDGIGGRSRSNR